MSKIIENFLLPLFVIICIVYAFNSFGSPRIMLTKAYHHLALQPNYLERGTLSFYFSGNPTIQQIKEKDMHTNAITFFLPHACVEKGECENMIKAINTQKGEYSISLKEVTKPTRGLQLCFTLDPSKCLLRYESFDSIGLQKGIVFHIYNKELLSKLESNQEKSILRTLWAPPLTKENKVCIVIDPGHGGNDSGAIGFIENKPLKEKDVCLSIAHHVSDLLRQKGCSVLLTRNDDTTLALDKRTTFAHDHNADLFISIHANYANNKSALGVETFCMKPQLLIDSFSQLTTEEHECVVSWMKKKSDQSLKLANSIQSGICSIVSPYHQQSIDRKVKYSVSQVLLGTQMPAILIEVGFLSHKREVMLLSSDEYQRRIAQGIFDGVMALIF